LNNITSWEEISGYAFLMKLQQYATCYYLGNYCSMACLTD